MVLDTNTDKHSVSKLTVYLKQKVVKLAVVYLTTIGGSSDEISWMLTLQPVTQHMETWSRRSEEIHFQHSTMKWRTNTERGHHHLLFFFTLLKVEFATLCTEF